MTFALTSPWVRRTLSPGSRASGPAQLLRTFPALASRTSPLVFRVVVTLLVMALVPTPQVRLSLLSVMSEITGTQFVLIRAPTMWELILSILLIKFIFLVFRGWVATRPLLILYRFMVPFLVRPTRFISLPPI